MTRLVKKAAAAKNIPLLALALFAAVFMGSKVYASFNVDDEKQWLYNEECDDPLNASCYTAYEPETLATDCEDLSEICGIVALEDQFNTDPVPRPLIDPEMEEDIEAGLPIPGRVYLRPHTP